VSFMDVARIASGQLRLVSPPRRRIATTEGFYIPPADLGEGKPGDVIRAEPMDAYLVPGVRFRARAWRMLYRSTSAVGDPTAVSGTLLVPFGRMRGPRPLIGYAVGTHGIGDAAAPSRLLARGLDWEAGLIAMVLARGWAVAITDYEGLGTPGDHTYMVGRALGPNVLDAMRAARQLHPEELASEGPAAIVGYSEGGAAAAWAAQLQPTYAPDMPLAAVAAGAAAADLEAAGPSLDGSFFSFFIAYGGIGYSAAYPELDLDPYLTLKARAGIAGLRESTLPQAMLSGPRFIRASDLTRPNVMELPEWRRRLRENRLGAIAPSAPVLLHHARRDQIVSFEHSVKLRDSWERIGADVRLYVTRGGLDHVSGGVAGMPVALGWIAGRLRRRGAGVRVSPPVPVPIVAEQAA
jgi:secretory lipase